MVDMIVAEAPAEDGGGFFLDCPRALRPDAGRPAQFLQAARQGDRRGPLRGARRDGDLGRRGETEYGLCYADPRLPALGIRCMLPPHLAAEAAADLGATLVEDERIRGASHRARRAARRARLPLQRRLPARSRHGPAQRHRFREGLLRRPGGRLARRASRHRAQARRAGDCSRISRPRRACRSRSATSRSASWARPRADAASRCCISAGSATRSRPAQPIISGGIALTPVKPDWAQFDWPGEAKAAE